MQTFSGSPIQAPVATGEGVFIASAHLQGYETTSNFPAMNNASNNNTAALIHGSVENLSRGIAAQVRVTSVDVAENDNQKRT